MYRLATWEPSIQRAQNERTLSALLREYLANIDRTILEQLPEKCRLALAARRLDIANAALALRQEDLREVQDPDSAEFLRELALVLGAAAIRLGQLRASS